MKAINDSGPKLHSRESFELPIHLLILREELNRRLRSNSSYSLRSFAKAIGIDASLLSKIMNNCRALSHGNALKIMESIALSDAEKVLFWKSYVVEKQVSNGLLKDFPTLSIEDEKLLEQQIFNVISEPYHYVLVELTRTKSFKSDVIWISKVLNLSIAQTKEAINRLVNIKMLSINNGQIERSPGRFSTKDKAVTDSAHKYHQRKILEKAIVAMDQVPIEHRNQSSMTIAINPQKIPIAKKMIQDFINQLSDVLESGPIEEVYQISLSLYPVLQKTALEEI